MNAQKWCNRCGLGHGEIFLPVPAEGTDLGWSRAAYGCPDCGEPGLRHYKTLEFDVVDKTGQPRKRHIRYMVPDGSNTYTGGTVGKITVGREARTLGWHEAWALWRSLTDAVKAGEARTFRFASDIDDRYLHPADTVPPWLKSLDDRMCARMAAAGPEKPPQRIFAPKMVADSLGGEIMPQGEDMAGDPDLPF